MGHMADFHPGGLGLTPTLRSVAIFQFGSIKGVKGYLNGDGSQALLP